MSQSGYTPIQLYYSTTAAATPSSGNLANGELALNITDGKLFYKDNGGTVQVLATKAGAAGDVVGPASSTDNALVRFDSTTGKLVQNSTAILSDAGALSGLTDISASGSVTLSGGTANGVAYLNGSKVLTSGSALTFDGTNVLGLTASTPVLRLTPSTTNALQGIEFGTSGNLDAYIKSQPNTAEFRINSGRSAGWGGFTSFYIDTTEQMRLTSTGLGIGTSSPTRKLSISGTSSAVMDFYATSYRRYAIGSEARGFVIYDDTASAYRMEIDSSGNLGLGVTPSAWGTFSGVLEFAGGANIEGFSTGLLGMGSNHFFNGTNFIYKISSFASRYIMDNTGGFKWFTAPSGTAGNAISFIQAMTLDASGNLGIGTSSPSAKLDVQAAANAYGRVKTTSTGYALFDVDSAPGEQSMLRFLANGVEQARILSPVNEGPSQLVFTTGASSTERARIDSSGNFGIGTSSPGTRLDVSGNLRFSAANPVIEFNNGGAQVYSTVANTLQFASGGGIGSPTERARIDSSGNLLVGTTSGSDKLTVNGSIYGGAGGVGPVLYSGSAAELIWYNGYVSWGYGASYNFFDKKVISGLASNSLANQAQISSSSTAIDLFGGYNGTTQKFAVANNGQIYAVYTSIATVSDVRLKENIRDLDSGLDDVMALKPRKYDWKDGKGANTKNARGFIAQEFEQVFPDLVIDSREEAPEGEEPYKAVKQDLIPTLVKAIQEQQAIINDLKARLDAANL